MQVIDSLNLDYVRGSGNESDERVQNFNCSLINY